MAFLQGTSTVDITGLKDAILNYKDGVVHTDCPEDSTTVATLDALAAEIKNTYESSTGKTITRTSTWRHCHEKGIGVNKHYDTVPVCGCFFLSAPTGSGKMKFYPEGEATIEYDIEEGKYLVWDDGSDHSVDKSQADEIRAMITFNFDLSS